MEDGINHKDMVTEVLSLPGSNVGVRHTVINDFVLISINHLHEDGPNNSDNKNSSF